MLNRLKAQQTIIDTVNTKLQRKAKVKKVADYMMSNHDLMSGKTAQMLNGTDEYLNRATVEELYWLCRGIEGTLDEPGLFDDFFTDQERQRYTNSKALREDKTLYPITFETVLQVEPDQWVTVVETDTLIDLYNKQLINYNKNTQRPATRRERNGLIEYKISIKPASVASISKLMSEKLFIPNAITLNVSETNQDNAFSYHNGTFDLTSGVFDILDGFHRLQGIIKTKAKDPDFNYRMILNIVAFDDEKAAQYIAQEDKKNKIRKTAIHTMDANNPINIIVNRLNTRPRSALRNQIGRSENFPINSETMYMLLDKCYSKEQINNTVETGNYLEEIFNELIETKAMDHDVASLAIVVKTSAMYRDDPNYIEKISKMLEGKKRLPDELRNAKRVTPTLLKEIEKLESWVM